MKGENFDDFGKIKNAERAEKRSGRKFFQGPFCSGSDAEKVYC